MRWQEPQTWWEWIWDGVCSLLMGSAVLGFFALALAAVLRINAYEAQQCVREGGKPTSGAFLGMICVKPESQ